MSLLYRMAMIIRLNSTYKTHKMFAIGYHVYINFMTDIFTDGGRWLLKAHRWVLPMELALTSRELHWTGLCPFLSVSTRLYVFQFCLVLFPQFSFQRPSSFQARHGIGRDLCCSCCAQILLLPSPVSLRCSQQLIVSKLPIKLLHTTSASESISRGA